MKKSKEVLLTDRFIRSIEPPKTDRNTYNDKHTKRLSLRVTASGKKTFCFSYRLKGLKNQQRETLGEYPDLSLSKARKIAAKLNAKIVCGESLKEINRIVTVAELVKLYWEKELKYIKTADEEYRKISIDILPAWGSRDLKGITTKDVVGLLETVREKTRERFSRTDVDISKIKKRGNPTVNRYLTRINRMFRFACEQGLRDDLPTDKIRRNKEGARTRYLTPVEIKRFWNGVENSNLDIKTKIAQKLYLLLGQRSGEICTMSWESIDWERLTWENYMSKTEGYCLVPLGRMALDLIKYAASVSCNLSPEQIDKKIVKAKKKMRLAGSRVEKSRCNEEYIFKSDSKDGHLLRRSVARALDRQYKDYGVEKFTPHDLRRTMRTMFSALGIDRVVCEIAIGHKLRGVEGVYDQHEYLDELREAFFLWEKLINVILSTKNENELQGKPWEKKIKKIKNEHFIDRLTSHMKSLDGDQDEVSEKILAILSAKKLIKI